MVVASYSALKKPYDAMVFIHGTDVIAVDSEGTKIASGTAGTDDSTVIQAAENAVPAGGMLIIQGGSTAYVPATQVVFNHSIDVVGKGDPVIHWYYPTAPTNTPCLLFTGTAGSTYDLALTVAKGTNQITYTGDLTAIISEHDLIEIYDDTIWQIGNGAYYDTWKNGELHQIKEISFAVGTTTITFYDTLIRGYETGDNAKFVHYIPIKVNLNGIDIVGNDANRDIRAVSITYCSDSIIDKCNFSTMGNLGIIITRSYNIEVNVSNFKDMDSVYDFYGDGGGGNGYGVMCSNSCAHIRVNDCEFDACRHGFAAGGAGGYGQSRDLVVKNCFAAAINNHALESHADVDSITFEGNTIYGNGATGLGNGIISGARTTIVKNNKIFNANTAIGIRHIVENRQYICKDNYTESCNYGFNSNSGGANKYDNLEIKNNTFVDSATRGIYTNDADEVKLSGNTFDDILTGTHRVDISGRVQTTIKVGIGYGYDFSNVSDALAVITDNSTTKHYVIEGHGSITDTGLVTWKSYVDLVGIGLDWNINYSGNGNGITLSSLVYARLSNFMVRRNGTVTTGSAVIGILGTCDKTVILKNIDAMNQISSVITFCSGIYIADTANPKMIRCNGTGSNGATYAFGYRILGNARPEMVICKGIGGDGGTDCHGMYIAGAASPDLIGCTHTPGKGGTSCNGLYVSGAATPSFTNCKSSFQTFSGTHSFTGANTTILPFASKPYFLVAMYINVTVAGTVPDAIIHVGTTNGGDEIAQFPGTLGANYIAIYQKKFAADATIYVVPNDLTNARFTVYYIVGYNYASNYGILLETVGNARFSNCIFEGNEASSGGYIATTARTAGKYRFGNCHFICHKDTSVSYALEAQTAGAVNVDNSTYTGGVYLAVPTDWDRQFMSTLMSVLEILGTPRLVSAFKDLTGTSITDYTRLANTLTASASVATWYGFQGRATYYDLDGTTRYLYRANDTDFDFGDSVNDQAFSVVVCVYADAVASRQIIGKWDANNLREWRFFLDASGYPTIQLWDESTDKYIGRQYQVALVTTGWKTLVATYDGSKTSAGCKIYLDGVQVDNANYEDAVGYVAMEAINTNLMVGALKTAGAYSEYFDGKLTWPCVAAKELSADEAWALTQRLKGVLGI